MSSKILLSSDEVVICPKCSTKFPVAEGITEQVIEQHEGEYDKLIDELTKKITKEAVKDAEKSLAPKTAKLQKELEQQRTQFQDELKEKDASIKDLKARELSLLKDKKKLDEEKNDFELLKERELDKARKEIEKKAAQVEAERFELKEAEYKKRLEDAGKVNDELTRKLAQGSQQLQGEVYELKLESILRECFPIDDIREVGKGARGADVIQRVCGVPGQTCGIIIWEAKREQK